MLADQLKLLVLYFWDLSLDQSCLGYINYVSNSFHCHYKAFADDNKLYLKFSEKSRRRYVVVSSHCRKVLILLTVSRSWNLHLISDNCVVMKIRISMAHYVDLDALSLFNQYFLSRGL